MSQLIDKPLLGPLIALNGWAFAMEGLMYKRRVPALKKYGVTFDPATVKQQKADKLPPFVIWAADNYNNLQEQPTQFYAVALALTLLDVKDKITVRLAWAYVAFRVVHSLIHVSVNQPYPRFLVFAASSFTLVGMAAKAAWELFF
ncbi:hypothetical protein CGRA01v4_01593 [Colletotrichum graminicola]|uniref:MAPEG family protein n=1 Tax=Colletotrichum graminicola (strain M1.001 / M2 / FGSC 10212) TaxID=645133 RepID=E3QY03_COLGM|nr:uncharacterized protein GLRG_10896 [Colletotrichum graminicola M1.001]EFQ35741.1 hypothetical protein GLRG_10896 [Colletotrichum graminicola M1.001]WDK10314.1 hypothetical protein CGRA01v4_01593 [Colletotrichum graminicola]